ncbi:MAG: hypothetical protein ACHQX0_06255 [Desulfobaccales bacterium]
MKPRRHIRVTVGHYRHRLELTDLNTGLMTRGIYCTRCYQGTTVSFLQELVSAYRMWLQARQDFRPCRLDPDSIRIEHS